MIEDQTVLLLLLSPDHIQMPSCDLLCLNRITGLDTGAGKGNLVCYSSDISQDDGKKPVVLSHTVAASVASGVWSEVQTWAEL